MTPILQILNVIVTIFPVIYANKDYDYGNYFISTKFLNFFYENINYRIRAKLSTKLHSWVFPIPTCKIFFFFCVFK